MVVLEHASRSALAVDIQDVIVHLAFDDICIVVFGVDASCLCPGLGYIEVERAFHEAIEATAYRFMTPHPIWKTMRFLGIVMESSKRLYKSLTILLNKQFYKDGRNWQVARVVSGLTCCLL